MQNAGDEYACLCMCSVRVSCACLPVYMQCVSAWWRPQNACTGCACRGVCKGVPVCDDGEAGLLSFNTVLPGHWAVCKCTELTAEAQPSLVHPPTSSPPPPRRPSHRLTILSDWQLGLSHETEAQKQIWLRTSVEEPSLHRYLDQLGTGRKGGRKAAESFHVAITFITSLP